MILWEMPAGSEDFVAVQRRHTLRHTLPVSSVSFTPNGRRLAIGHFVSIGLWDVASGYQALSLDPIEQHPFDISFSPDGSQMASGNISVWTTDMSAPSGKQAADQQRRWHLARLASCESNQNWFGAAWHLSRLIEVEPESFGYYVRRGRALAERGNWELAEQDIERSIALKPNDPTVTYQLALMRLHQGDSQGYRELCKRLLAAHGGTDNLQTANAVAWNCALGKNSADYDLLLEILQGAGASTSAEQHAYLNIQGALLYRAGRYQAAVDALSQGIVAHKNDGIPMDWLFLAMAHHQLGNEVESDQWLRMAEEQLGAESNREKPASVWERLELKLLIDEAWDQY